MKRPLKLFDEIYQETLNTIIQEGVEKTDRTSVGSNISHFAHSFTFNMNDGGTDNVYVPFLQVRKFVPRIFFEELMWMLRGQTDVRILQEKKVNFWNDNSTNEFLDSIGRPHIKENTIGKGYGYQMRNFNGVDQLKEVFEGLKNNPLGRRHVISFWNPADLNDMALEPCHYSYVFSVQGEYLNLAFTMRSSDFYLAGAANTSFAAMWLAMFAKALGLKAGKVAYFGVDVHLYSNAVSAAQKVIQRDLEGIRMPTIEIKKEIDSLEDILSMEWSDIEVHDFDPQDNPENVRMAV